MGRGLVALAVTLPALPIYSPLSAASTGVMRVGVDRGSRRRGERQGLRPRR